jgi:nickel transport protein
MQKDSIRLKRTANGTSAFALFIFVALWLIFFQGQASAHKATIFAWVEGDTIHTQSKLSGGKRVKGGEVIVFDPDGVPLLKGNTDDNGMFSFAIPQKTGLKIVLKASMGHQAEWSILPEEMGAHESDTNRPETIKIAPRGKTMDSKGVETNETFSKRADIELSREDIQTIIDDALDRKLAPILDNMARTVDQGPGLTEIIGGIGYIIGLVGVALVVTNRRKKE